MSAVVVPGLLMALLYTGCSVEKPRADTANTTSDVVSSVDGEATQADESGAAPSGYALKVPRVHPPRRIVDVAPDYPEDARERGVRGAVVLELEIERTGVVSKARVVRGIPLLNEAAVEAAMKWKYERPLLGSKPVAIKLLVTVVFD